MGFIKTTTRRRIYATFAGVVFSAGILAAFYFVFAWSAALVSAAAAPVISSVAVTGPFVEYPAVGAARIYYKLAVNGAGFNTGTILVANGTALYAASCSGGTYCGVALYQDVLAWAIAGAQFPVVARIPGNTNYLYGALTGNNDSAAYTAAIPGGSVSYQQSISGALVPVAPGGSQGGGSFVSSPVLDSATIGAETRDVSGKRYWPVIFTGSNFKITSLAVIAGITQNNTSFDSATALRSYIYQDAFVGLAPGSTVGVAVRTPGAGDSQIKYAIIPQSPVVVGNIPVLTAAAISDLKEGIGGKYYTVTVLGKNIQSGLARAPFVMVNGGAVLTTSIAASQLGPGNKIRQPNSDENILVGNLPLSAWVTLKPGDVLGVAVVNTGNKNPLFGAVMPDSAPSNSLTVKVPEAPVTGGAPTVVSAEVSGLIKGQVVGVPDHYAVTAQCFGCFSHGFGETSTLIINGGVVMTDVLLSMGGLNGSDGGNIGLRARLALDKWPDLRPGAVLGVQIGNPNYVDASFGRVLQSYTYSKNSLQVTIAGPVQQFTAPVIQSIDPTSVSAGTPGVAVTLSGGGFRSDARMPAVMLVNGEQVFTSYASADKVFAAIPAKFLENPGTLSISVRNPAFNDPTQPPKLEEQTSANFSFVVSPALLPARPRLQFASSDSGGVGVAIPADAPIITEVLPPSAPAGSGDYDVIVIGENFYEYSEVRWNGTFIPTQFVSDAELHATIPGSVLGVIGNSKITVYNPSAEEVSAMQAEEWVGEP